MYGLKFSKEDHVKFIKLLLSLIEIPDLEPAKLNKFCIVLSQLLRLVLSFFACAFGTNKHIFCDFVVDCDDIYIVVYSNRKTSWLTPDDLEIDWKPLYKLANIFLNKNSTKGEIYRYFP